jgi:hypothetical protein
MRRRIVVSGTVDERLRAIVDLQRGLVSRGQLLDGGITANVVDRLVRSGRLRRIHAGVYAVLRTAAIPWAAETAALLAARPGALLSHHTAAALWGLRQAESGDGQVHALVLGDSRPARPVGVCVHRTAHLAPGDVRMRRGLPVSSPVRTILDVAPALSPSPLEVMIDQALFANLIRQSDVERLRKCSRGRRGCGHLVAILSGDDAPVMTRSEAERIFLGLIRRAELPMPEVNIRGDGVEPDFMWRNERLIVEIDGWDSHGTQRAFEDDRRRDAIHRAAGFSTMRVTCRQLRDEPLAVLARVAQALTWNAARTVSAGALPDA